MDANFREPNQPQARSQRKYLPAQQNSSMRWSTSQGVFLMKILITIDTGFKHSDEDDSLLISDVTTCFISVINTGIVEFIIRYSSVELCMKSKF